MLRQLLAILALVTGLAALAEPAQAARVGASVESVSQAEQASPCVKSRVVLQLGGDTRPVREARERPCISAPRTAVLLPTVQLQADRARE